MPRHHPNLKHMMPDIETANGALCEGLHAALGWLDVVKHLHTHFNDLGGARQFRDARHERHTTAPDNVVLDNAVTLYTSVTHLPKTSLSWKFP